MAALDGEKLGKPAWFTQQSGAWCCLRTHMRLMEDALNHGHDLFLFEDDCVFAEDFETRCRAFLEEVPADWDMVYLGGLHRMPPVPVSEGICLGRAVTTTYAYGLRHAFLKTLYPLLLEAEQHHIDQMLARLQARNAWKVYCPSPWLVGMDAGMSDICGRYYQKPHWWNIEPAKFDDPIILQQLLSRVEIRDGVQYEIPLTSQQSQPRLTITIGGWFSPECGEVYRRACQRSGTCRLVEVGCWRGRSLSFLADLISTGAVQAHAVDTWRGNTDRKDPTHGKDVFAEFKENMARLGIGDLLKVIRLPSVEASLLFPDESLDVVMIDADHEYAHVLADLRTWYPKLKPDGVLLGHDFSAACACPGVVRAVKDFAQEMELEIEAQADMFLLHKQVLAGVGA